MVGAITSSQVEEERAVEKQEPALESWVMAVTMKVERGEK